MGCRSDTVSVCFLSVSRHVSSGCEEMELLFQVTPKDALDSGIQSRIPNCKVFLLMERTFYA